MWSKSENNLKASSGLLFLRRAYRESWFIKKKKATILAVQDEE